MSGTEAQSIDELIMCLVGMGFELEDAQQAITAGKLSVDHAIEWILSGKPMPAAAPTQGASGRLTLHNRPATEPAVIGSNPFSNPQPMLAPESGLASSSDGSSSRPQAAGGASVGDREEGDGNAEQDDGVMSRLRMNKTQRHIKEKFEDKQRDEARKRVREERLASKKAHAHILQEIKQDREAAKIKRPSSADTSQGGTPPGGQRVGGASAGGEVAADNKAKKCLLQIRLPDGRALRQTFSPEDQLHVVWNFVEEKYPKLDGMILMQPFPRQEYGAGEMKQTLVDLKLVPSGSLVLKKNEQPPAPKPAEEPMDIVREPGDGEEVAIKEGVSEPEQPAMPPPLPPGMDLPLDQPGMQEDEAEAADWGPGQKLGQEDDGEPGELDMEQEAAAPPPVQPQGMDVGEDEGGSDEEEDMVGGFPPGMLPGWGVAGAGAGPGHSWGEGHRLAGEVFHPENMPHHKKTPKNLAAEAASVRFAQAPADGAGADPQPGSSVCHMHDVPRLVQLIIKHVSGRVCDSRVPLVGLQGLPVDLAMKVMEYLIAERLLKPKTLHPFVSCHLRSLILDCYPYTTNELLHALRLHTYISHLSMAACTLITDKGLAPLKALKRLKHLNLRGCKQLNNGCIPVIAEFENLVTLVLEDTGVNDAGIRNFAEMSPAKLQHLNLNRTDVTHHSLQALRGITGLRSLSVEYTRVGSLSGVQALSGLESLNLRGTPIVTDSLLCLANHPSLTALNLSDTPNVEGDLALQYIAGLRLHVLQLPSRLSTTDAGLQYLTDMPLHTLDLTNYIQIGDEGARYIGRIPSIQKLHMSNTKISDRGMLFLEGLKNLQELYLDRTLISDVGANIIKAFSHLQELSLSETGISNKFLKEGVLQSCPMISKVNLSKTSISSKGIRYIQLQHLVLLNLDGTRVRPSVEGRLHQNCPSLQRVTIANIEPIRDSEEEDP